MNKEKLYSLKQSFYGWEYAVENKLTPEITYEEIVMLANLFDDHEEVCADAIELHKKLQEANTRIQFLEGLRSANA